MNRTLTAGGISIKELTERILPNLTGRTVIDKTGIIGKFDTHLEWAPEMPLPPQPGVGSADDPGKSGLQPTTKPRPSFPRCRSIWA